MKSQLPSERRTLLWMAFWVQGGLLLATGLVAWWFAVDWRSLLLWTPLALAVGLIAVIPMRWAMSYAVELQDILVEVLGPSLIACRTGDLLLISALAGIGEEFAFRGVLPTLAERFVGYWTACVAVNLLFGALHFVSWEYFLYAMTAGFYFSWLTDGFGPRNLLAAMITHTVYDFVALRTIRANAIEHHRTEGDSLSAVEQEDA